MATTTSTTVFLLLTLRQQLRLQYAGHGQSMPLTSFPVLAAAADLVGHGQLELGGEPGQIWVGGHAAGRQQGGKCLCMTKYTCQNSKFY